MRELYVGATDDLDCFHDPVRIVLELLLDFLRNGEHGSGTEGVPGVNPHGIYVLDKADGDHLVFGVPHYLQLQFFPADNGFFNEDLADEAGCYAALCDGPQFILVVGNAPSPAAQGVGGPDNDGVTQIVGYLQGLIHGISGSAQGHGDFQFVHGVLELDPVFAPFYGIGLDADDLHPVFVQDAMF